MYKLLVVDDEEEVRQGLIQKMVWQKYGFEIVGEAQNGREALDIVEESTPDIIITDISMPVMNGLELSEYVQMNYPTIKVVVLTGFDDFNFAQKAIRFGVEDYILKPVLPKDIESLLLKLQSKLDQEKDQRENIAKLKEHFNESLPLFREKLLSLIIEGSTDSRELKSKISDFDLKLKGKLFAVAATHIDSNNADRIFSENDTELMRYAVLNIAREIIDKYAMGEAVFHFTDLIIIFSFPEDRCSRDTINRKMHSVLEEIRQNVEKYLRLTLTIGVGGVFDELGRVKDSYKAALSALQYKSILGQGKIIFIEDMEPLKNNIIAFDDKKEKLLVSAVKFGSQDEIQQVTELLFKELVGTQAAMKEYQLYFLEIVAAVSRICRDLEIDMGELLGVRTNLFVEILEFKSLNAIRTWIEEICVKIMAHIQTTRQNSTRLLLEKALDYVRCNYQDETLSIQKVANQLHISSSYLSMIFKKETGDTFLKFLVRVRLEAAVELLKGSYKTAEIAERVGYPDISYFSYFFKKNYGLSPREFRNQFQKKESLT